MRCGRRRMENIPKLDVTMMTKIADTRRPMRPSYSLPVEQAGTGPSSSSLGRRRFNVSASAVGIVLDAGDGTGEPAGWRGGFS
jgi:hypothetical protein